MSMGQSLMVRGKMQVHASENLGWHTESPRMAYILRDHYTHATEVKAQCGSGIGAAKDWF